MLAVLLWVGAIAAFASSVLAGDQASRPPDDAAAPIPTLSEQDVADARRLASSKLEQILGPGGFAVRDVGVWHTRRKKKLGAVVVVESPQDRSFHADWPVIAYDRSESSASPYQDDHVEYTASHVSEFLVLVDLRRGRVVQVEPSGVDMTTSDVVGNPRRATEPSGE